MDFSAQTMLIDVCIISALLFLGKLLRLKLKFLQKLFIPVSLIAGAIGLVLGNQVMDVIPLSEQAGGYSGLLISVLMATLFLGKQETISFKSMKQNVGDTFLINTSAYLLMYGIAALIGLAVLPLIFPGINEAFGMMM